MGFVALDHFKNEIDPARLRIISSPRIIWVFGGRVDIKAVDPYISNRNVFLNDVFEKRKNPLADLIRIPESYQEWNSFEGYPDLLQFERDAGYLANMVILFCESPGALAELGTFAADEILCAKTLVVISNDYRDAGSYISLGPLKRIERIDEGAVCVVDANLPKEFENELDLVIDAANAKLAQAHKKVAFDSTRIRDVFLLIADLVDLHHAITRDELTDLLSYLGANVDRDRLRQLLNQLVLFGLVAERKIGHVHYLIPTASSQPYIDYTAAINLPSFDRLRFKATSFAAVKLDLARGRAHEFLKNSRA